MIVWSILQIHPVFSNYFVDFRREISEKGLKWTKKFEHGSKKSILTSFQVHAAPESCSNYTTGVVVVVTVSCEGDGADLVVVVGLSEGDNAFAN